MKNPVRRGFFLIALCVLSSLQLHAQDQNRIAVLDFEVQSNNPDYEFLGKGFAEFIAVDLSSVTGITIIDREKRNNIIEEQKFSASGLVDESTGVEIGNMLAANYLVTGSIFDMFGKLEVTLKLIDIEKGSATATAQSGGEPKEYKRIVTELSDAVVASLSTGTAPSPEPEPEPESEGALDNEQADVVLASFSGAMDAVDNDDVAGAKEKLKTVQKVDKTNEAARYYLNKLFMASPKFNVELIFYAPSYNPAHLGFIEKDRMYGTFTSNDIPSMYRASYYREGMDDGETNWEVTEGIYYSYSSIKYEAGYYLPIGSLLGLAVEANQSYQQNEAADFTYDVGWEHVGVESTVNDAGIRISTGLKLSEAVALGLSGYLFHHNTPLGYYDDEGAPQSHNVTGSATLGVYSRFLDGGLTIDSHVTAPFIQEIYIDSSIKDYIAYTSAPYPVVWETNVIGKLAGGRLFLSFKEILEIYTSFGSDNRTGVASRAIPAVEFWPLDFLSVRVGGEYDYISVMDNTNHGFGVLGGLTFRIGSVDIDANYTFMQRALRFYPGYIVPDTALLVQASWNGVLIKERK